jgi:hypothetical protein
MSGITATTRLVIVDGHKFIVPCNVKYVKSRKQWVFYQTRKGITQEVGFTELRCGGVVNAFKAACEYAEKNRITRGVNTIKIKATDRFVLGVKLPRLINLHKVKKKNGEYHCIMVNHPARAMDPRRYRPKSFSLGYKETYSSEDVIVAVEKAVEILKKFKKDHKQHLETLSAQSVTQCNVKVKKFIEKIS